MKILVCISKTPDTTAKINFTDNNTKFDTNNVQYIVNPYDEWYALVRGIELKETLGGTITTITVGPAGDEAIIRKALAIGADDAVRIDMEAEDAYSVATQIANYVKDNSYDLILLGKETIDYSGSQIGAMVAELLDTGFVSNASNLEVNGNVATVSRDIEGGTEIVEVNTPFVVSCAKGMAEQRIPNMRGIMTARTKPITVVAPIETASFTSIASFDLPAAKAACKMVDAENVGELVDLLQNEAKVL